MSVFVEFMMALLTVCLLVWAFVMFTRTCEFLYRMVKQRGHKKRNN